MATLNSIIDLYYPTASGVALPTNIQPYVLFDREIDTNSCSGNIFITGPDQDTWSGPDLQHFTNYESIGTESEILQSPGFAGIVQGTFTFQKINPSTLAEYSGYDYAGTGTTWRTKAIFVPSRILAPNTTYSMYVSGDENTTDTLNTGIKSRTVFDTLIGTNTGTGTATIDGSYTGTINDIYHIEISTAGDIGVAKFTYYKESAPTTIYGPYYAKRTNVMLDSGVWVSFSDGSYDDGDTFSAVVVPVTTFSGTVYWQFETGSGSITSPLTSASTTLLGDQNLSPWVSTEFYVVETTPVNQATNLNIFEADYTVDIEFSLPVDNSSFSTSTVSVISEPVNGDVNDTTITYSGVITPTCSTSGTHGYLIIPSGLLFQNNVVTITLDKTISTSSGQQTMEEDYSFYFTTSYDPLYSSVRKLRLDIGAYLTKVPDDTINLAIFEASLAADLLTWAHGGTSTYYEWVRREWVTCKTEEILLLNLMNKDGGLKSKKLGDFETTYNVNILNNAIDRSLGCQGKWLASLQSGGYATQNPTMVIKGQYDPDRPTVGRLWDNNDLNLQRIPAANAKTINRSLSRRYVNNYTSNRWTGNYYNAYLGKWGK